MSNYQKPSDSYVPGQVAVQLTMKVGDVTKVGRHLKICSPYTDSDVKRIMAFRDNAASAGLSIDEAIAKAQESNLQPTGSSTDPAPPNFSSSDAPSALATQAVASQEAQSMMALAQSSMEFIQNIANAKATIIESIPAAIEAETARILSERLYDENGNLTVNTVQTHAVFEEVGSVLDSFRNGTALPQTALPATTSRIFKQATTAAAALPASGSTDAR